MQQSALLFSLFFAFACYFTADAGVACVGGKCFEHFDGYSDWSQAVTFCETKSGHPNSKLSIITNAFENSAIMAGMSSTAKFDWIGLHQVGSFELSWAWYDGTPLNYTNWSPNFPQEGHRCAQICHFDPSGSGLQGKWISTNCVDPMSVSCEYPDPSGGISTTARAS